MYDFFWNLFAFIFALGILIAVHEYGHFWVARKNNVKVERFSIGFGKVLWRKFDKQGTEFVIALIPLGGYVKMLDERVDIVSPEDANHTFNVKNVYQRIAIIAAGPLANFIFAIFAFYLMFVIGVPNIKPIVTSAIPGSIVAEANLPPNSEIYKISGKKVNSWQDVNLMLVSKINETAINVELKLPSSVTPVKYVLDTSHWHYEPQKESAITSIGIKPYQPLIHNKVKNVEAGSPAEIGGIKIGDVLLSINGKSIDDNWSKFSQEIKNYPEQKVNITVLRGNNVISLVVEPKGVERNGTLVGYVGVAPEVDEWPQSYKNILQYGAFGSLVESIEKTWDLIVLSFDMIGKLITGDVSIKNLSGPISIAQGAGSSAEYGLVHFLGFLGLISINLGIINLLPLPVLDGGHLLYYLIELVTGKPVSEKVQQVGFKFGAIALLSLMSLAFFNDLSRL